MRKIISLAALVLGAWLLYTGHDREHSLAGKADSSLSRLGTKIDGEERMPTHEKYYIAGIALVLGGAVGLGLVRK